MVLHYDIDEVRPYINWLYFDHAWSMSGKSEADKASLYADANALLDAWQGKHQTHAVFELFDANSDGDDLLLGGMRLPMLRQQRPSAPGQPNLCLADFVRPLSQGKADKVGVFATTVDEAMNHSRDEDVYRRMLAQVLSDRLAEGTAELMHQQVRKTYWGYAPDENLSMKDIHAERYQGIRPAVGYPSMPDTSVNFIIDSLIDMKRIGIRLTASGMMHPHASVSGLMFAHPQSRYFDLGKIGEDQLRDYARRRQLPVELMRNFLSVSLMKR